jgi:hypothetical protein
MSRLVRPEDKRPMISVISPLRAIEPRIMRSS